MCGGSQGKAAGRRQGDRIEKTQDERQASRPQPFLHGPQRICRVRRLDDDKAVGSEAECPQPGAIEPAKLVGEGGRAAAQDCASRPAVTHRTPADTESQGEGKRCGPGRGPTHARLTKARFYFMHAADFEAIRAELGIDLTCSELPDGAGLISFGPL